MVPAGAAHTRLHERFYLGSFDDSITCRGCRSRFTLDRRAGNWSVRHYRLCPSTTRR